MSVQSKINLWKGEKHSKWLNNLFDEYTIFIVNSNKTNQTQEWEIKSLIYFFRYLENNNLKKITLNSVYNYVSYMNKNLSLRTVYDRNQCLKYFLNWLYDKRKIKFNGEMIFFKLKQPTNSSIISYYTNKEISEILNSVSIKNKVGKKNFAIISLFAYLGIRRDDVRTLRFESIDWDNNLIKFNQNKTNILTILPMPKQVKFALLDYIKNARPNVKNDFIFIKDDGSLYGTNYLSVIINRIVKNSGINIKGRNSRWEINYIIQKYINKAKKIDVTKFKIKITPHIFRHSKAMHLLDAGIPLSTIEKLLGHSSIKSTEIYAKANPKKLEEAININSQAIKIKRKYNKNKENNLLEWLKYGL